MPDQRGYVSALYNSILSKDILGRHKVRNAQRFVDAAYVIMQQFSREISYDGLAAKAGVSSPHTVQTYVGYLSESYLVSLVRRYSTRPAERIREVFDTQYHVGPEGLCGNGDCGQMSAWYLFSAMGFYPFNPCGGEYVIGAPQVPAARVKVGGEGEQRTFRVLAKGLSKENKYVKTVTLNGKPIRDWKIRHEDIMKGGELVFEMGK